MESQLRHEHPLEFLGTDTSLDIYYCKDCDEVLFQNRECA